MPSKLVFFLPTAIKVLLRKKYYLKTSHDHVYVPELIAKIRKFVEGENKQMRYIYLLTTKVYKYQNNLPVEVADFLPLEIFNPTLPLKCNYNKQTPPKLWKSREQNSYLDH